MKTNDLTKRYIYAVTKNLPAKMRKDVADELSTLIADMLEERCKRCGKVIPDEHDIRVVLTELGTPGELAEKYHPENGRCLIGAPYYTKYIFVLRIVLIAVAFGLAVASVVLGLINSVNWFTALIEGTGRIFGGLLVAFAFVTLLFALFYRYNVDIRTDSDSLDGLPPIPPDSKIIKKSEPIFGIVLSVLFGTVFLATPQIFCVILPETGSFIPIFNIQTIRQTWLLIVLCSAMGIIHECAKLIDGRHSKRLMLITVITDVITAGLSVLWLSNAAIMNPEFTRQITAILDNPNSIVQDIFANFQYFFLGVILFALALDIVDCVVRTLKPDPIL